MKPEIDDFKAFSDEGSAVIKVEQNKERQSRINKKVSVFYMVSLCVLIIGILLPNSQMSLPRAGIELQVVLSSFLTYIIGSTTVSIVLAFIPFKGWNYLNKLIAIMALILLVLGLVGIYAGLFLLLNN